MEHREEWLSINGGPPIKTKLRNPDRANWIAGPFALAEVNVEKREHHHVAVVGGERDGWKAAAGHGISSKNPQEVFLNGKEPFESVDHDPNQTAARIVRKATEGK